MNNCHVWLLASAVLASLPAAGAMAQQIPAYDTAAVNDPGRPAADKARDADRKPAESVAFSTVKPGDKVLELIAAGGYFTRILSKAVGPNGHVYATMPEAFVAARPNSADAIKAIAADPAYRNVTLLVQPSGTPTAPEPVDVVWTSLNYHDLHNPGPFGAGDMAIFNKAVFDALKPGGVYLVIDHAAAKGSGFTQTGTVHRVDPEAAKAEILKAGFAFDGESKALSRPDDDYSARSTDKDDQFIYRFRKPR
jgi:predicted methyltransferase